MNMDYKPTYPISNTNNNAISNSNLNVKYKTSRCRHFEQHGNCQMAEKCHFAHGDEELRSVNDVIIFLNIH